jgi:diguanylate cyclase (GGDEF)-like protein
MFALILPQTNGDAVQLLIRRLRSTIMEIPFDIENGCSTTLKFSIGIASISEHTDSDASLIAEAVKALDAAKEKGGHCVYTFTGEGDCRLLS